MNNEETKEVVEGTMALVNAYMRGVTDTVTGSTKELDSMWKSGLKTGLLWGILLSATAVIGYKFYKDVKQNQTEEEEVPYPEQEG